MKLIPAAGMDHLRMAVFQGSDVGDDKVWGNWQFETSSIIWQFLGYPDAHSWAHIRKRVKP